MKNNKYLDNFINNIINDDNIHIAFVSDVGNKFNEESALKRKLQDKYGMGYFYHEFNTVEIPSPYEPFLEVIKACYQNYYSKELTLEEFINSCGVYSLQKKIFLTYLETGTAKREEKPIIAETHYERYRMVASVVNILKFIAKKYPLLIMLGSSQCAPLSTIELVKEIHGLKEELKLNVVCVFSDTEGSYPHCRNILGRNIAFCYAAGEVFDYEYIQNGESHAQEPGKYNVKRFEADVKRLNLYNARLNNLLHMFALEDMEYFVECINNSLYEKNLDISPKDKFNFYYYGALCYIYSGNNNLAVFMADKLGASYDKARDWDSDYRYNYICNQIHMAAGQSELAEKYALLCMDIARKLQDEFRIFFGVVLYYEAKFGGWKSFFQLNTGVLYFDVEMISNLKEHGYKNTLAHYLIYAFNNDDESIRRIAHGDANEHYNMAIDIIHEIDNTDLEISAYTKCIVMMNNKGYHKAVDEFYEKNLHLLKNTDNPKREANLHLGRGYGYILNEQYDKGEESFLRALDILYRLKNAESVAEVLYNMVLGRMCAQDYKTAGMLCRCMFDVLENLEKKTIQLCSQSKLLSLRAICFFMTGNEYKSYEEAGKIRKLVELKKLELRDRMMSEDTYLYELIEGLLASKTGKLNEAIYHFEQAGKILANLSTATFYTLFLYYTKYYTVLMESGDRKRAAELLVEAMCSCEKNGFVRMAEAIEQELGGTPYIGIDNKNPINEEMNDRLLELSLNVGREFIISKQKKEIWFLSSWQEMLSREWRTKKALLVEAMNLFQDSFNLDRMLYASVENGRVKTEFCNFSLNENYYQEALEFFQKDSSAFIQVCISKNFGYYEPVFKLLDNKEIYTLIGIPVYLDNKLIGIFAGSGVDRDNDYSILKIEDLTIMQTAIMQVYNTLERISSRASLLKANERLSELAITDQLTGLYNRQGAIRVTEQLSHIKHEIPVLCIDLDNFKYYNDTFGHETGDIILYNFAKILNRVTREDDFVIRYGGDEFIIFFSNGDIEAAKKVAERIFDAMERWFKDKVLSEIGVAAYEIPEDRKLSCSIGIAVATDSKRSSIQEALQRADVALYDIKRSGKGSYGIWYEGM